jgi:hypothetical protein
MNIVFENICSALKELSVAVLAATSEDRTIREINGGAWNLPPLTRQNLAFLAENLAERISSSNLEDVPDEVLLALEGAPNQLKQLHSTIPQMFNGNASQAVPIYTETINWLLNSLAPYLDWDSIGDQKLLPGGLIKRLAGIKKGLDLFVPQKEEVEAQIKRIKEANDTAESLPADLQTLKEARATIEGLVIACATQSKKVEDYEKSIDKQRASIEKHELEAQQFVRNCENAYKITTTKGLAAAFDQRAFRVGTSMWIWVFGLIAALVLGAIAGSQRINALTSLITQSSNEINWSFVWINVGLSVLSVAAPFWFAWIATKQIGQRFRLAEDYGFKASVAKAYEGYRSEAVRIDPVLEARLFASALTRLEEAPLRLIEPETHGSPWHELFASKPFSSAMSSIPGFKDKFLEVAKDGALKLQSDAKVEPEKKID